MPRGDEAVAEAECVRVGAMQNERCAERGVEKRPRRDTGVCGIFPDDSPPPQKRDACNSMATT